MYLKATDLMSQRKCQVSSKKVAEAVLGYTLNKDCVFIVNSGRYEFRNKGIDIFIDSLGELQNEGKLKKGMCGFLS